jgi:hypothetical protein
MPKLPPPPRSPQKRSALSVALAVSSDDVGREQVVAGQAVHALQPADAAPEGEAGDARRRYGPTGSGQPERLRLAIELTPGQARLCTRDARGRIHAHALHRREVNDDAVVADGLSCDVVAAAAYGDWQPLVDPERECGHDVGHAGAAGDHCGSLVDHPVVDLPRRLVSRIGGAKHLAAHPSSQ